MAVVDRDQLYLDVITWLPESNTLTEAKIRFINERVIADVGDDDANYGEIVCKALQAAAKINRGTATVDSGTLKSEKVGNVAYSYDTDSTIDSWKEFLDSLPETCKLFGYDPTVTTDTTVPASGMVIGVSASIDIFGYEADGTLS